MPVTFSGFGTDNATASVVLHYLHDFNTWQASSFTRQALAQALGLPSTQLGLALQASPQVSLIVQARRDFLPSRWAAAAKAPK